MADDRLTWLILGFFLGALILYFLTRDKVVELTRDEQGHITSIMEKMI